MQLFTTIAVTSSFALQFDREHFNEIFVDLKWFESKVGNKYLNEAAGQAAEEAQNCKKKKSKVSGLSPSYHLCLPACLFSMKI